MNKFEKIVVALLVVIAACGVVVAIELNNGFEVELTMEGANDGND